jgi:hypothetical protein
VAGELGFLGGNLNAGLFNYEFNINAGSKLSKLLTVFLFDQLLVLVTMVLLQVLLQACRVEVHFGTSKFKLNQGLVIRSYENY